MTHIIRNSKARDSVALSMTEASATIIERHLSSRQVRGLCGNVSEMSVWRMLKNPDAYGGFPMPVRVGRRRFWRESEINEWLARSPRHVPNGKAA